MVHRIITLLVTAAGIFLASMVIRELLTALFGILRKKSRSKYELSPTTRLDAMPLAVAFDVAHKAISDGRFITALPRRSPEIPLERQLPRLVSDVFQKYEQLSFQEIAHIGVSDLKRLDNGSMIIGWSEDSGELYVRDRSEEILAASGGDVDGEFFAPSIYHAIVLLLLMSGGNIPSVDK